MFTGIIQAKAQIRSISHGSSFTQYSVQFPSSLLKDLIVGASVAVHGICQTVRAIEGDRVHFDAIQETLACTTVSSWKVGEWVNLERSLKMGDEVGGHFLSGHVLGTGHIENIEHPSVEQAIFTIRCSPEWIKYCFPKGYIALNGVSLTLGKVSSEGMFTVNLIPETQRLTTFGEAIQGEQVNIEIDKQTQIIVDTLEKGSLPPL